MPLLKISKGDASAKIRADDSLQVVSLVAGQYLGKLRYVALESKDGVELATITFELLSKIED